MAARDLPGSRRPCAATAARSGCPRDQPGDQLRRERPAGRRHFRTAGSVAKTVWYIELGQRCNVAVPNREAVHRGNAQPAPEAASAAIHKREGVSSESTGRIGRKQRCPRTAGKRSVMPARASRTAATRASGTRTPRSRSRPAAAWTDAARTAAGCRFTDRAAFSVPLVLTTSRSPGARKSRQIAETRVDDRAGLHIRHEQAHVVTAEAARFRRFARPRASAAASTSAAQAGCSHRASSCCAAKRARVTTAWVLIEEPVPERHRHFGQRAIGDVLAAEMPPDASACACRPDRRSPPIPLGREARPRACG